MGHEVTPTLRSTHLCGAQALPIFRTEDEAFFTGNGACHVPWALGGTVEGGSVSKQWLRAASQSCTGTMDTAVEKKEGINQWVQTSSARRDSFQVAHVWDVQRVADAYRVARLSLSPGFFWA